MKIELKNVKFSEAMSEETNAFTADLYINSKKVGYCKNTGQGGCTDYYGIEKYTNEAIQKAEAYCKALPKTKWKDMEFDQSLESVIDDLMADWLKAKETKKMEKRMQTCILVGSPDENLSYSYYNFKAPLSSIPRQQLQGAVGRIKMKLNSGEAILNTNLTQLGITV